MAVWVLVLILVAGVGIGALFRVETLLLAMALVVAAALCAAVAGNTAAVYVVPALATLQVGYGGGIVLRMGVAHWFSSKSRPSAPL